LQGIAGDLFIEKIVRMNREIIKDEIKWLLDAINEQYGTISLHGDRIPQIEFDILMDNLRKMYENLHMLKRLDDPHFSYEKKTPAREPSSTVKSPPPDVKLHKPAETAPRPSPPAAPSRPPAVPANKPEPAGYARKPAAADEITLFGSEEPALNTRLKEARERTFSPRIPSVRIDNLKTAISINDKFMFINELFEGNLREYNETIDALNGFSTFEQAADYLDLLRKKNFWNTGSVPFKKLKELVERRF